jgi:hypothetical protein
MILYSLVPIAGRLGTSAMFVLFVCIIISMYGGGFSTIPAYLRDLFGTYQVGAIHGRVLTAWSTAAILGPTLVTYVREYQINHGVPKTDAYQVTMYILVVLLFAGFMANYFVKEVDKKHHHTDQAGV